jgi:hypothetical protein
MPKYRQLHVKILDSQDVNDMPNDLTRLTWVLLPLIMDQKGRAPDNASWIRSKLFPFRKDVKDHQIEKALAWFAQPGRDMILRYTVQGRNFIQIVNWKTYQTGTEREANSSIPDPEQVESRSGVDQELVVVKARQGNSNSNGNSNGNDKATAKQELPPAPELEDEYFQLYAVEIGEVTPQVKEALRKYPPALIPAAIKEAVRYNGRTLAYMSTILDRWVVEGPKLNGNGKKAPVEKDYTGGPLGMYVEH